MIAQYAIVIVTLLAAAPALAESLNADAARRFVMGKLFAFNCFDGSRGASRVHGDGSVYRHHPGPQLGTGPVGMAASSNGQGQRRGGLRFAAGTLSSEVHRAVASGPPWLSPAFAFVPA